MDPALLDRRNAGCRGSSLLEVVIGLVIIPLILGAGVMTLRSSSQLAGEVIESSTSTDKLRELMRRIGEELMCSSQTGEDLNKNGVLDPGEDINGNARLENDWAVSPASVRFNGVLPDGKFSLPVTYSLQDGRLVRATLLPGGTTQTVSVARRVLAFSVLAAGSQLTVSLSIGTNDAPQSSSVTVQQRN